MYEIDSYTKLLCHFNGNVGDKPPMAATGQTISYLGNAQTSTSTAIDRGTGADGALHVTSNSTLASGTYNFTSVLIDAGKDLIVSKPCTIKCSGSLTVNGGMHCGGVFTISSESITVGVDGVISGNLTIVCGNISNNGIITGDALTAVGGKTYLAYLASGITQAATYIAGYNNDATPPNPRNVTTTFKTPSDIARLEYSNYTHANTVGPQWSYFYIGDGATETTISSTYLAWYGESNDYDAVKTTGWSNQTYARINQQSAWRISGASNTNMSYCRVLIGTPVISYSTGTIGTVTPTASAARVRGGKFGHSALYLDGVNSYVTVPDTDDWDFGIGNWTIDCWINFSSTTGYQIIVEHYQDADNRWFVAKTDAHKLTIYFVKGTVVKGWYVMSSAFTFATGQWYHIAFIRNGAGALIFIDGVSQALTKTTAFADVNTLTGNLLIGAGEGMYVTGCIDEFRISKGIARWTDTGFTPPTREYGSAWFPVFSKIRGIV